MITHFLSEAIKTNKQTWVYIIYFSNLTSSRENITHRLKVAKFFELSFQLSSAHISIWGKFRSPLERFTLNSTIFFLQIKKKKNLENLRSDGVL